MKVKAIIMLAVLASGGQVLGCDWKCKIERELDALSRNNDPSAHTDAGLRVLRIGKSACTRRGGVYLIDKEGKGFCSIFPGQ